MNGSLLDDINGGNPKRKIMQSCSPRDSDSMSLVKKGSPHDLLEQFNQRDKLGYQ